MERINSLQEYKELLRWNKARFDTVVSNCLLLSNGVRNYIDENRLYYEKYENGVVVLIDEVYYWNIYYFWKQGADFARILSGKPALIEELSNNGSRDDHIKEMQPILFKAGFSLSRNNLQVEKSLGNGSWSELDSGECRQALFEKGFELKYCMDDDTMHQVVKLWNTYLDSTDIPFDHYTLNAGATILNVVNAQDDVVATHFWKNNTKTSECRHTVTHPNYYKQGLASLLIHTWLQESAKCGVIRWTTWISDQNKKSLALYHKLGFNPNGRTSKQYILK